MAVDTDSFEIFATFARQYGVDVAIVRFTSMLGVDAATALGQHYRDRVAAVQNLDPPILSAGGEAWYPGPSAEAIYWNPLRTVFAKGKERVALPSIDHASSVVVAHTPDPRRPAFDSKGLVVGYVQSGKTTNFMSVVAKLADEEYRLVIILAGVHNGLRKQTQQRLEEQLHAQNPTRWLLLTGAVGDFQQPPNPPVTVFSDPTKTALAIVKKNATVLTRLIKWLDTVSGRKALEDMRVLIIDDEADQASVATASINPKIRKLLDITPRHTYIGYTATPFANVFIDPTSDDLYPKSFILNLPTPNGYFGPERIFGNDLPSDDPASDDGFDMIRVVPDADVPMLRPVNRAAAQNFRPVITADLRRAILWFWLATAARHARGDATAHSTMLIHTAIPVATHQAFKAPVTAVRNELLDELSDPTSAVHAELRDLWDDESAKVPAETWDRVQETYDQIAPYLATVVESTRVILDNSYSQERLVYEDDKPLVAIAIGGNTLSRGLTLEGLVVSFFVRSASTYDTLMQMGRWFGYRHGYEDLPRIWMTADLRDFYRHLVAVEREMRDDIDHYQRQNLTPLEVAVRVKTHPFLRITAKMGAAQPAYVSFAGRRLYTRYFRPDDAGWLDQNLRAADRLLSAISDNDQETNGYATLFRDVTWSTVRQFLGSYQVHDDSPDMDRRLMNDYIERQVSDTPASLEKWSVAVVEGPPSSPSERVELGGREWKSVIRARLDGERSKADIKTLMNPRDRGIDLGRTLSELDAMNEQQLRELRDGTPLGKNRGLLVIYPIDRVSDSTRALRHPLAAARPVIGLGIVFPGEPATRNQLAAQKVAVDLTGVITEDPAAYEDDLEGPEMDV
ncbi:hypothetical protein J2Y46_003867 [Microbacterium sp. BE35]|nr:hypothetical protein [Microbacterium sp. BE35]